MNRYSMRLVLVGMMIGILTLSALAVADLTEAERRSLRTEPGAAAVGPDARGTDFETEEEPAAEAFAPAEAFCSCALVFSAAGPDPGYELLDFRGNSYGEIRPDRNREASLGPLPPGRYRIVCGEAAVGSFRVTETAALAETGGRLWTDGERLWLEDFDPGAAEVRVTLSHSGYYSFQLVDDLGRRWSRDVFISDRTAPDPVGGWVRTLRYDGLPEGRYTLVEAGQPLTQFQVLAGGTAMIDAERELKIEH